MLNINLEFQEEYKKLDKLCKDLFSSKDGITQYINEMDQTYSEYRRYINDWNYVYKTLKHMRYIRNKLAHDIGAFEENLCSLSDINWLVNFYDSILNCNDPLAELRRIEDQFKQTKNKKSIDTLANINYNAKQKLSLWQKIKIKIKNLFI